MSFKYEYVAIKTSPFGLMTNCGPCYNRPGKGGWGGNGGGDTSVIIDEIDNVRASIEEFKGAQASEFQAVALKYTKMRTEFYDTYGEINETFQLISDANGTTAESILELIAATEESRADLVTTNKAVANHTGALASIENRLDVEFIPRFGVVESSIQDFKEVQASENLATALSMERLDSKVNDNEASILEEKTTRADQYSSMSEILTEIRSSTENNAANIISNDQTYTDRFTANASRMSEIEAETESNSGKITNLEEVTADINGVVVSQGSTLSARIDGIAIGGRNLLRNADFKLGVDAWGFASITNSEDTLGNLLTVINTGTSADPFGLKPLSQYETITLIEGKEYVLSFYANGDIDEINNIEITNNEGGSQKLNNAPITSILNDRTEIVFTSEFTTETASVLISAMGYPKDYWFNIVAVKLEQGNIASDWTMAPEDTGEIIEQVEANIEAYKEAQALINLATAEDYSNMQTTVGENTGELERLDRLVVTNENAIGTIYTKLETDIDGNIAQIIEDYKAVSSDIGAMGTKLDGVYAQTNPVMMGSEEVMIGSEQHYAGVWTETGARIEQGLAESFRIDALKAEVGLNKGEIEKVDKLVVTNTEAIGTINTKLEVSIENDIAQIFDDYKVVVNKVDEVQSQVNPIMIGSTEFLIGNNEVLIGEWSETSARLEEDFVAATKLTKVETELNGNTSKVETLSESVNGLSASWSVQLNVNGKVSGIYQHSTGNRSGLDIITDKFTLTNGTNAGYAPFRQEGNITYLNMAVIKDTSITKAKIGNLQVDTAQIANGAIETVKIGNAQVDTLQIAGHAVTIPRIVEMPTGTNMSYSGSGARSYEIGRVTVDDVNEGSVSISFTADNVWLRTFSGVFITLTVSLYKEGLTDPLRSKVLRASVAGGGGRILTENTLILPPAIDDPNGYAEYYIKATVHHDSASCEASLGMSAFTVMGNKR